VHSKLLYLLMVHGRPSFGPLDSPITGTPSGAFQSWGYSEPDVGNAFHRIWTVPIVKIFVIGFQVTALDAVELSRQTSCHHNEVLTDQGSSYVTSYATTFTVSIQIASICIQYDWGSKLGTW